MAEWQSDEALARQLQAEEELNFAKEQQQQQLRSGHGNAQQTFQRQLQQGVAQVSEYEDETLQAQALSLLPDDILGAIGSEHEEEDRLARRLLAFFKNEFFTWVNNARCSSCSSEETKAMGRVSASSPEEIEGRAQVVEIYRCMSCGHDTRFPRYNAPGKLLETRSGRCGEWSNCFTLLCRAVGLEARYARCWEDHVFTEFYSSHQRRWIHMDPCENEFDKPLLYEEGWGKAWSYVIGFGRHGVANISLRYSKDHAATKGRQQQIADPKFVTAICEAFTSSLREGLAEGESNTLRERDRQEALDLQQNYTQPETPLPGRQTGSTAWKAARGELGDPQSLENNQKITASQAATSVQSEGSGSTPATAVQAASVQSNASLLPNTAPKPRMPENLGGVLVTPAQQLNSKTSSQPLPSPGDDAAGPDMKGQPGVESSEQLKTNAKGQTEENEAGIQGIPRAPRKALAGPTAAKQAHTPMPALDLTMQNLRMSEDSATKTQAMSKSGETSISGVSCQGRTPGHNSARASQQPSRGTEDKEGFVRRVRAAFEELMAKGNLTPNQAAVLALERVKKECSTS